MGKFALMRSTNWRMKTKQTIKLRVLNLYFVEHLYKIYRKISVCVGKGLTLDNLVVQHFVFFDFTVVVVAFLSFFWLIGHNQPKQQKKVTLLKAWDDLTKMKMRKMKITLGISSSPSHHRRSKSYEIEIKINV